MERPQDEVRAQASRTLRHDAHLAWRALRPTPRAGTCGYALGSGGIRRYVPSASGLYARDRSGSESCEDQACPMCGRDLWLRRWASATLAIAEHVAGGGRAVFLSFAGAHGKAELAAATARLWWVGERIPGSGTDPIGRRVRRRLEALGMVGHVRVMECTFLGLNGAHPNGHVVLLFGPGQEPEGELADRVASLVQRTLIEATIGTDAWWETMQHYATPHAFDCRPAGVSVAGYIAKLSSDVAAWSADGAALLGAGSELADPGADKVRGNLSERALPAYVAATARARGYGARSYFRAIRRVPLLAEAQAQAQAWARASKGRTAWRSSRGLLTKWAATPLDELLGMAAAVGAAEDVEAVRRILAEPTGRDPGDGPKGGGAPGPFDDDGVDAEPPPAPWHEEVWISAEDAEQVWAARAGVADDVGGWEAQLCQLLDDGGPWRALLAVGSAVREVDGVALSVWARGDPGSEVLHLSAEQLDPYDGWVLIEWAMVRARADASPRWETVASGVGRRLTAAA